MKIYDSNETKRGRFFCPSRIPRTERAKAFVQEAIDSLSAFEEAYVPRNRRRKLDDQKTYIATVTAVVCDLAHCVLLGDQRDFIISRSKEELGRASRYKHPAMNQRLPHVLDMMSSDEVGWIKQKRGYHFDSGERRRTILSMRGNFVALVCDYHLEVEDLGQDKTTELIILKGHKEGYGKKSKPITYSDTNSTRLYRSQLITINDYLEQADIQFDGRSLRRIVDVDTTERRLHRSFTRGSFESGGRLGGGFWMNLEKEERLRGIRINGERVVGVDYKASAPRILYGITGKFPPRDDLYEIKGIEPKWRDGIKKLMMSLMFSEKIPEKRPKDSAKVLPGGKVSKLFDLIIKSHFDVADCLPSQIGHYLQFRESEILIAVMLSLMAKGVIALSIHDCVLVPESAIEITKSVMTDVFKEKVEIEGAVSVDDLNGEGDRYEGLITHSVIQVPTPR